MALEILVKVDTKSGTASIGQFGEKIKSSFRESSKAAEGFGEKLNGIATSFAAAVGFTKFVGLLKSSVKAFDEQAIATAKLQNALRNVGVESPRAIQELNNFSSGLQRTSLFGDEAVTSVQSLLISVGKLTETGAINRATQAAADFAAATGRDIEEAATLFAKAAQGNMAALARYGISLDANIPKSERFNALLTKMETQFGGAAKSVADSTSGMTQLGNAFGDLLEGIGGLVAGAAKLSGVTRLVLDLADAIKLLRLGADDGLGGTNDLLKDLFVEAEKNAQGVAQLERQYNGLLESGVRPTTDGMIKMKAKIDAAFNSNEQMLKGVKRIRKEYPQFSEEILRSAKEMGKGRTTLQTLDRALQAHLVNVAGGIRDQNKAAEALKKENDERERLKKLQEEHAESLLALNTATKALTADRVTLAQMEVDKQVESWRKQLGDFALTQQGISALARFESTARQKIYAEEAQKIEEEFANLKTADIFDKLAPPSSPFDLAIRKIDEAKIKAKDFADDFSFAMSAGMTQVADVIGKDFIATLLGGDDPAGLGTEMITRLGEALRSLDEEEIRELMPSLIDLMSSGEPAEEAEKIIQGIAEPMDLSLEMLQEKFRGAADIFGSMVGLFGQASAVGAAFARAQAVASGIQSIIQGKITFAEGAAKVAASVFPPNPPLAASGSAMKIAGVSQMVAGAAGIARAAGIGAMAEGGMMTSPGVVSFAERGPEIALPLRDGRTTDALAEAMMKAGVGGTRLEISGDGMLARALARAIRVVGEDRDALAVA